MSRKKFFIADTHFGDENILLYENRPYKSVDDMDFDLIEKWNSVVADEDDVYIIGDFGAVGYECEILNKLNGKKFLIKGNHDIQTNDDYREYGFAEVYDHPIIIDGFWILSHEPLYVSENLPYANIFGHVHASPIVRAYSSHHFCVSVERINYSPISLDDIIKCVIDNKDNKQLNNE